jgi:hypothetical protein
MKRALVPAVIRQAIRIPTNRMVSPMNPCVGSRSSRHGEANPMSISVSTSLANPILGAYLGRCYAVTIAIR